MGLMPATLFFRMTYSESIFVMLSILALGTMERRLPIVVIALIVGLATASRPVAIGLLAPFLLHCWHRSETCWAFLVKAVFLLPVACWGIAAFALYQGIVFDDALAFVHTQSRWGASSLTWPEKLVALLSYEPIWQVFDRSSPSYWATGEPYSSSPFFCWALVNPIYFVLTAILIAFGAWKRWLTAYEITLAAALLVIPYVTRSYEMGMASHARFAAVVFPVYLVLGNILARLPGSVAGALLGVSGFFLGAYSALFACWYDVF
jgi:hypothetical protein